jgi:hypothetical protein
MNQYKPAAGLPVFSIYTINMEDKFSPEQSLQLIQQMITNTRQSMSDKSIYFLVWGWLTFAAFTGQFILKHVLNYEKHYLVWLVIIPGVIFSVYQGNKDKKQSRVRSYIDDSIGHLWGGMAVCFFVLCLVLSIQGTDTTGYPFFIMLYGLGTYVSGSMIRFSPLANGGLLASGLAIGSAFVSYDYQILFGAAAILVSYIVPAHLLRIKNKRNNF